MDHQSSSPQNGAKSKSGAGKLNPFHLARCMLSDMLPKDSPAHQCTEGLLRSRSIKQLAGLGEIPDEYRSPDEMWPILALRQISALFKKNEAFSDPQTCSHQAEVNFQLGEKLCRITNKRLTHYFIHDGRMPADVRKWVGRMQADISELLGSTSDWLDEVPNLVRLTNGATEDRPRKRSYPFLKITGNLRVSSRGKSMLTSLLHFFGVDASCCKITGIDWNTISLVPKNWKTFRTIAKEPTHSLPFQLSLDSFLKRRLRAWGIDLRFQSRNQVLARQGSRDGSFATIDLSMASDTLAHACVVLLLSTPWLNIFEMFRSAAYRAPWGRGVYAKFSSMGNGYTFTLETLIFAAACRAVGSRQFAVYGDDIVIETEFVLPLLRLLKYLGFSVNEEKSFVNPHSRFRESCGHDYYDGHYVTPFYLRETPKLRDHAGISHVLNGSLSAVQSMPSTTEFAQTLIETLRLRLVPWNTDTRSGVFIPPNVAWRKGILSVDRRMSGRDGVWNPDYGFPVYKGYAPQVKTRKTRGWRSYLLWHLQKRGGVSGVDLVAHLNPGRTSEVLDLLRTEGWHATATRDKPVTSEVGIDCRYVHKTRRYDPKTETPSYVYSFAHALHLE